MNLGTFKGSIRVKMLGGVLALEILLVACYAGVLYYSASQSINLNAQKAVEQSQGIFNLLIENDSKMLGAAMDSFATNAAVSQIFADHQDRHHQNDKHVRARQQCAERFHIKKIDGAKIAAALTLSTCHW